MLRLRFIAQQKEAWCLPPIYTAVSIFQQLRPGQTSYNSYCLRIVRCLSRNLESSLIFDIAPLDIKIEYSRTVVVWVFYSCCCRCMCCLHTRWNLLYYSVQLRVCSLLFRPCRLPLLLKERLCMHLNFHSGTTRKLCIARAAFVC